MTDSAKKKGSIKPNALLMARVYELQESERRQTGSKPTQEEIFERAMNALENIQPPPLPGPMPASHKQDTARLPQASKNRSTTPANRKELRMIAGVLAMMRNPPNCEVHVPVLEALLKNELKRFDKEEPEVNDQKKEA